MAIDLLIVKRLARGELLPEKEEVGIDDLPGDWRVWFEERAAIMEYHGGLPREHAEAGALKETVGLMVKNNTRLLTSIHESD